MQYFGRVFLRSNYTHITQNTYIQSSMVTEIFNIEKWGQSGGLFGVCILYSPWRHTRFRFTWKATAKQHWVTLSDACSASRM